MVELFVDCFPDPIKAPIPPHTRSRAKQPPPYIRGLDIDHDVRVQILETIFKMGQKVGETYHDATFTQKTNYLGLFFKLIKINRRKIVDYKLSELVEPLIQQGAVRVRTSWLLR